MRDSVTARGFEDLMANAREDEIPFFYSVQDPMRVEDRTEFVSRLSKVQF